MNIIDGKAVSAKVLEECKAEMAGLEAAEITPGLAVVLVGNDPASRVYVGSKVRTCEAIGIYSRKIALPIETSEEELLRVVEELNNDSAIHGILVQSPLPEHIDEAKVVLTINPSKDVDGFHPDNVAKLTLEDQSGFVACTPAGCMRLLEEYNIETAGKEVVIVGRSMIVGKPMALLLVAKGADATVTIAHSRTKNLAEVCRRADILVAAVGRPEMVTKEFVKPGAVVIDVGVNRVEDASKKSGYRLTGDVAFEEVSHICEAITPVPGGVGPMTIAMLMKNTLKAARQLL